MSDGLIGVASMRITTSSGPGSGTGTRCSESSSFACILDERAELKSVHDVLLWLFWQPSSPLKLSIAQNANRRKTAMQIKDKIVVVTGAASGIGRALAQRFAREGAKLVVCSDLNGDGAAATAKEVGGIAFTTDVAKEADIQHLIETVEKEHGPIDLFCSNAGIGYRRRRRGRRTSAGSASGTST